MSTRVERLAAAVSVGEMHSPAGHPRTAFGTFPLTILALAVLALAGCGGTEDNTAAGSATPTSAATPETATVAPTAWPERPSPGPTWTVEAFGLSATPTPRLTPAPLPTTLPTSLPWGSARCAPAILPQFPPRPREDYPPPGRWEVYVATEDGEPRKVADSEERLYIDRWSPDGQRLLIYGVSQQEGGWMLRTILVDDPGGPGLIASSRQPLYAGWSPDGAFVAFDVVDAEVQTATVWLASADGARVWRLEGLGHAIRFVDWAPDGYALLVKKTLDPSLGGDRPLWLILMPMCEAIELADGPVDFPKYPHQPAWSPSGEHLLYALNGDLYLLDRNTLESRRVTTGGDHRGLYARSPDGRLAVTYGGRLVDLQTGTTADLSGEAESTFGEFSPDGRFLAVMEKAVYEERPVHAGTLLYDVQDGTFTRLTNPARGADTRRAWTPDGRYLVTHRSPCYGCEAFEARIVVVDVSTGEEKEITDGFESKARFALSPDGTRILVTGPRLRVASADGTVLREIAPPAGMAVAKAVWSPDGQRFAYLVEPADYFRP